MWNNSSNTCSGLFSLHELVYLTNSSNPPLSASSITWRIGKRIRPRVSSARLGICTSECRIFMKIRPSLLWCSPRILPQYPPIICIWWNPLYDKQWRLVLIFVNVSNLLIYTYCLYSEKYFAMNLFSSRIAIELCKLASSFKIWQYWITSKLTAGWPGLPGCPGWPGWPGLIIIQLSW